MATVPNQQTQTTARDCAGLEEVCAELAFVIIFITASKYLLSSSCIYMDIGPRALSTRPPCISQPWDFRSAASAVTCVSVMQSGSSTRRAGSRATVRLESLRVVNSVPEHVPAFRHQTDNSETQPAASVHGGHQYTVLPVTSGWPLALSAKWPLPFPLLFVHLALVSVPQPSAPVPKPTPIRPLPFPFPVALLGDRFNTPFL